MTETKSEASEREATVFLLRTAGASCASCRHRDADVVDGLPTYEW